jgi:hypothetical protein
MAERSHELCADGAFTLSQQLGDFLEGLVVQVTEDHDFTLLSRECRQEPCYFAPDFVGREGVR